MLWVLRKGGLLKIKEGGRQESCPERVLSMGIEGGRFSRNLLRAGH